MDKNNPNSRSSFLSLILLLFLTGCIFMTKKDHSISSNAYYFSSPAKAIQTITELLKNENFKILSKYYDLSNSNIDLAELESGDFFIQKQRPEIAHPSGFWRYKHPFAPGYIFKSSRVAGKKTVYVVEVSISIDQGLDSPAQQGLSYFYMLKSNKGWKILPDEVSEDDLHIEMPGSIK